MSSSSVGNDGKPDKWSKKISGTHISASAGNYRIHRSGEGSITAYQFEPFVPLGTFETVKEAQTACFDYWKEHHDI